MLNKIIILITVMTGTSMASINSAKNGFVQDKNIPFAHKSQGDPTEGFNDITNLPGWIIDNQSNPVGSNSWFQGTTNVFNAHSGADNSYIAANFNNTAGSDICNYLILPDLAYLESISFWTRTSINSNFPDRLLLLHSPTGGTNTGDCINGFGDFTNILLNINPELNVGGFPEDWTQYTSQVQSTGKVAFVYFVTDGGNGGINSNYVGIDTVSWVNTAAVVDLDLSITNSAFNGIDINDSVTFTQSITNHGPLDATNTNVASTFSDKLDYVSNNCNAVVSGTNLNWNIGNLASGSSANCDIVFAVADYGRAEFQATATADESEGDINNNSAVSGFNGPIQIIPSLNLIAIVLLMFSVIWIGLRRTNALMK